MQDTIVIVGGGVIGLDVATILAERGYGAYITVVAEHLPGDTSINYTSPWAGANFSAISGGDANALRWDKLGYKHLLELASQCPDDAFVRKTPSFEYWDEKPSETKIKSMSEYLQDFKILPVESLPQGVALGISFTTLTTNAPMHVRYLFRQLKEKYGVRFIKNKLSSIQAGFLSKDTKIVFNCTGNGARTLAGVEDSKCYPTRGQILLARAPHVQKNVMRHGSDYETYIIPRPGSNGNVILGGYMQKGVSTGDTFSHETESILERTTSLLPDLKSNTEILAAFSGLRPSREGGARVERQDVSQGVVVHNYGAGGTGFQAGWGMSLEAVAAINDILEAIPHKQTKEKARL